MAVKRGRKQARRSGESAMPGWAWLLIGLVIGGVLAVVLYLRSPQALDSLLPHPNPAAKPATAGDNGVAPDGSVATAPSEVKKPRYDFYTLLPEKEVVIPDEELSARVKAEEAAKLASQQQVVAPVVPGAPVGAVPTVPPGATSGTTTAAATPPTVAANPPIAAIPSPPAVTPDATIAAPPAATKTGQYLLQAGAFRNANQADDLKARIAMLGLVGRVEIVQTPAGAMHRVRLGPYATASELEQAKQKLGSGGMPAVAIRVK